MSKTKQPSKRSGRPLSDDPRNWIYSVNLTEDENRRVEKAYKVAAKAKPDFKISQFLRAQLLSKIGAR